MAILLQLHRNFICSKGRVTVSIISVQSSQEKFDSQLASITEFPFHSVGVSIYAHESDITMNRVDAWRVFTRPSMPDFPIQTD